MGPSDRCRVNSDRRRINNDEAQQPLFVDEFERTQIGAGQPNYDVSLDGSSFMMVRHENPVTPTSIRVVLNWPGVFGSTRNDSAEDLTSGTTVGRYTTTAKIGEGGTTHRRRIAWL